MLAKILSPSQDELLRDERRILSRLKTALIRFEAGPEHQSALEKSIELGVLPASKSWFENGRRSVLYPWAAI